MELIFTPLEAEIDRADLRPYTLYRWQGRFYTRLVEARIARDTFYNQTTRDRMEELN